jgi:hypothetical protein
MEKLKELFWWHFSKKPIFIRTTPGKRHAWFKYRGLTIRKPLTNF